MAPSPPPSIGVHTCKGWQGLATSGVLICCRTHSPATEAGWLNYRDWSGRDAREPFQKSREGKLTGSRSHEERGSERGAKD